MFDWSLDHSSEVARQLLADECKLPLAKWSDAITLAREAKQPLCNVLNPVTGRTEHPVEFAPSGGVIRQELIDALETVRMNCGDIAAGAGTLFLQKTSDAALAEGKVKAGDYITRTAGIKVGGKLSRALARYLTTEHGLPKTTVDAVVTYLWGQISKRIKGNIALSVNPLDMVLCSMNAAFSSCHAFSKCHQAGPQQLLQDPHHAIAYFYTDTRDFRGYTLPFKRWRQLVHVHPKALLLLKEYGEPGSQELRDTVLKLTVELHKTLYPGRNMAQGTVLQRKLTREGLAYRDAATVVASLNGLQFLYGLEEHVPCSHCGKQLDDPKLLTCSTCHRSVPRCDYCSSAGPYRTVNGCKFCAQCAKTLLIPCYNCRNETLRTGMLHRCRDGSTRSVCTACNVGRRVCDSCGHHFRPNGVTGVTGLSCHYCTLLHRLRDSPKFQRIQIFRSQYAAFTRQFDTVLQRSFR